MEETNYDITKKIPRITLLEELEYLISILNHKNIDLLKNIFPTYYEDFYKITNNIIKSNLSDVVITFGNNNYISKIFIEKILETQTEKLKNFQVEKVYFNANIHSSEDYVLKKICNILELDPERKGFDKSREVIEEYYRNYKKQENKKFLLLIYDNIEHLFFKKKQTLFYTLLEIVNISSNILFCGITSNFNIMDLMEKRVRSRFSQKTIYINLKNEELFFYSLEDLFYESAMKRPKISQKKFIQQINKINLEENIQILENNNQDEEKIELEKFTESRIFFENKNFLKIFFKEFLKDNEIFNTIIKDKINMGLGITEIITQIKYILTIFLVKFNNYSNKKRIFFEKKEIINVLETTLQEYKDEIDSSYKNMLMSKFLLIFLNFIKIFLNYI